MKLYARVRAWSIARKDPRAVLPLRWVGYAGCDHVLRDAEGRLFGVDLVLGRCAMFVGVPPRLTGETGRPLADEPATPAE